MKTFGDVSVSIHQKTDGILRSDNLKSLINGRDYLQRLSLGKSRRVCTVFRRLITDERAVAIIIPKSKGSNCYHKA